MKAAVVLALVLAVAGCASLPSTPPLDPALPATAEGPAFGVRKFDVDGNTLLDAARLDALLATWTGPVRHMADVQSAAAALRAAYAGAGYGAVSVDVPEQRVDDGRVRLLVHEPRIREVAVEGATHASDEQVLRTLPALRTGATPNTIDLARQIRLANDNPNRRVSVDLRRAAPGQLDALVGVQDDKPWRLGGTLDDTGTPSTGRLRAGAFLQHTNVADLDHVATLQYVTSPERPESVHIAALSYRVPLPSFGDAVDFYTVHSDVDSGVVGDAFQVRGRGTLVGLRYTRNLDPLVGLQHRTWLGFENRLIENRVGPIGGAPDLVPDVTLHPLSVGYIGGWSGTDTQLDASFTALRNIPGGDKGRAADVAAARANANPRYTVLRYAGALTLALRPDTPLRVAFEGQWTRDALVSAEQFGIGGAESVRGFDERAVTNDRGLRTTVELQTPNVGAQVAARLVARGLVFFDQGWVHRNRALPGEVVTANVASVGAGVRLTLPPAWQARLDVAHVLQGAGVRPRGDDRLHVSVGYAY